MGLLTTGNYRDNKRHGKGVYQGPSSCSEDKQGTSGLHDKYDGEWRDGKRDGYGTFWYKTGSSYEGTWRGKSLMCDLLAPLFADEAIGCSPEGRKHGQGVFMCCTMGISTRGTLRTTSFNGFGVLKTHEGEMYEGYWSQGRRHGEGQYLYKNGDLYNGEWSHNRRHRGRLEYHNGEVYEGTFRRILAEWQELGGTLTCQALGMTVFGSEEKGQPSAVLRDY